MSVKCQPLSNYVIHDENASSSPRVHNAYNKIDRENRVE